MSPEEFRMYNPRISEMHMNRMVSMSPGSFIFPYIENTKFLNLGYLVFFNSQKYFWYSDHLLLVAKFYITWLLPNPNFTEQFSQGNLRCCLLGWSPKKSHQIKHNSQLLDCEYFLSWQSYCKHSWGRLLWPNMSTTSWHLSWVLATYFYRD